MIEPIAWLRASGAQADVIDGLARFASDWPTLWNQCPRGDWLLGIAVKLGVEHRLATRAAIGCAKVSAELASGVPVIAQAFARALAAAEAWANGGGDADADAAEVARLGRALEEAMRDAPDPATEAASRAALAVTLGVADPEVLASAPAAAAEAQMMASIDCGLELAMRWAHDKCADAVRDAIPWSAIETCLARTT